jgi:hypothetical protein
MKADLLGQPWSLVCLLFEVALFSTSGQMPCELSPSLGVCPGEELLEHMETNSAGIMREVGRFKLVRMMLIS